MTEESERKLLIEGPYQPIYSSFGSRFAAFMIGFLILGFINTVLSMFPDETGENPVQEAVIFLLSVAYKPVTEAMFGATLAKRWFGIKVVNKEFKKPDLKQALLRNSFNIVFSMGLVIFFSIDPNGSLYKNTNYDPGKGQDTSFSNFTPSLIIFFAGIIFFFILNVVDSIFIVTDEKRRSLHDRIAGTYVIMDKK